MTREHWHQKPGNPEISTHFEPKIDLSDRPTTAPNDLPKGQATPKISTPHTEYIAMRNNHRFAMGGFSKSPPPYEIGHGPMATLSLAQMHDINISSIRGKYVRFVPIAQAFASMSKLPGTKVGCVIIGNAGQVLSSGWNGAPRGSNADVDTRKDDRKVRLDWTVHAEGNAIANAARSGTALEGGTLVCTLMPCMTCAKLIVQAGITKVLCPEPTEDSSRWAEEFALTRSLLDECGIPLVYFDTFGK